MEASYDSRCPSCGERIREGDEIFRDDDLDAWVCEGCEPAPLRIKAPPKKVKTSSLADKLEGGTHPQVFDPARPKPLSMSVNDIGRIVTWLGWFMGEGEIPTTDDVKLMRYLLPHLPPGEMFNQLESHIEYARSIGVK